ncbi:MAG: DNA polymerase/3'-5' exonuclease PolX [Thermodesulfobacteriota bacterium]
MPIHNNEIRDILENMADMLEIDGENPFRVRAYREAARMIDGMSEQVEKMVKDGRELTEYRGIGKDLAGKIAEIVETGTLKQLEDLKQKIPASLLELLRIPELGPKRIAAIYKELGVTGIDDLKQAAEAGRLSALKGFGKKSEQKILDALGRTKKAGGRRLLLNDVKPAARAIEAFIEGCDGVKSVAVAGSYRRGRETIGDLDVLVTCRQGYEAGIMDAFVHYEDVRQVDAHGKTKSSVRLRTGLQVDLRIVPQVSYGAALHYFTGSRAHNIAVRKLGQQRNYKINEYGVYEGDKRIAGKTEQEVYDAVGLAFIEPELRENLGEIQAAQANTLPTLVRRDDIRGDLHAHTLRSDGHATIEQMAEAAKRLGYEYIAITEHSQKVTMAHGLNETDLREHMAAIDAANDSVDGITILKGIEVDILPDGTLDLPDRVLKDLDITIGSIHYQQRLNREKQTERLIRAMDNPYLYILGHPSARLINSRESMDIDLEKIIEAARDRGVALELNAHPQRLDLSHTYCKYAAEIGVKIAISTDAHSEDNLGFMQNGITEARRGWLEKADVVNTRPLKQMRDILRRD